MDKLLETSYSITLIYETETFNTGLMTALFQYSYCTVQPQAVRSHILFCLGIINLLAVPADNILYKTCIMQHPPTAFEYCTSDFIR